MPYKRIVYLLDSNPSPKFLQDSPLEGLQKNGFQVEAWNLAFLFRGPYHQSNQLKNHRYPHKKFSTAQQVVSAMEQLPQDTLIVHGLSNDWYIMRGLRLFHALKKRKLDSGIFANETHPPFLTRSPLRRASSALRLLATNPSKGVQHISRALSTRLTRVFISPRIRPAKFVWFGASLSHISKAFIGTETKLLQLHEKEYDQFLALSSKPSKTPTRFAVFIDAMGPLHPDYLASPSRTGLSMDVEDYAHKVDLLRRSISQNWKLDCQIAAHPSASLEDAEKLYGDQPVFFGITPEKIRDSSLVLSLQGSRALHIAVLLRKPILILDSVTLDEEHRAKNKWLSEELGQPMVSFDKPIFDSRTTAVNEERYRLFQDRFIKPEGTPNAPFWKSVAESIRGDS